ncbi:hypothetical protein NQ318_004960 [Aromia moschata]|uniref:Cytochrome P450 n=1 Tax=Aromia moschata TaxID=1265417 RepID=A0AAV8XAQ8_9CUCU|nr:hypothetical protein NQ318_004960 [Aromia moschata]
MLQSLTPAVSGQYLTKNGDHLRVTDGGFNRGLRCACSCNLRILQVVLSVLENRNVPFLEPTIPFGSLENAFNKKLSDSEWTVKIYTEAKSKSSKYCGMYLMTTPNLIILDMELLKKVLTKDFMHFTDRGIYVNEKDDPLSAHLFNIGGNKWKTLRAKLSPTFTSGKLKAMFQTLIDAGVILENHFLENVVTKDAIDIKDVLARFTTDIIGSCAFGIECNSFKEPDSPFRKYGKRYLELNKLELVQHAFNQNFKAVARALGSRVVNADVSKFFMKVVEDVVAYRKENQIVRKDFLQLLIDMKSRYEEDGLGDQLTMDELAAQCFVFFLGGFETSSTTMTLLCLNFRLTRIYKIKPERRLRQYLQNTIIR